MAEMSDRPEAHTNRRTGGHLDRDLPVILVGGATASGKSAAALDIAEAFGGVVINADSMQVYRELKVLTARPAEDETARAPHELYGVLSAAEACSAGLWLTLAQQAVAAAQEADRLPVLVGGTGLYLRAFEEGLAAVPPVPADVVDAATRRLEEIGASAFHSLLVVRDPAAARISPTDSQRMVRAWSVLDHTGRSLSDWRAAGNQGGAAGMRLLKVLFLPDRAELYPACDRRFEQMVAGGAVDEVADLLAMNLEPSLPAMRAVGVREIAAHLAGELSKTDMIARGQTATRQYAKRQFTWFRRQMAADQVFDVSYGAQDSESLRQKIFTKIRYFC